MARAQHSTALLDHRYGGQKDRGKTRGQREDSHSGRCPGPPDRMGDSRHPLLGIKQIRFRFQVGSLQFLVCTASVQHKNEILRNLMKNAHLQMISVACLLSFLALCLK